MPLRSSPNEARAELLRRLEGVDGWFHEDEAWTTLCAVSEQQSRNRGLTIVEIGSWKGRSTIALATALELGELEGRVIAIDPHTGNVEHVREWGAVDTFDEFLANLDRAGVRDRVEPWRASSHDAHSDVEDRSVDLLLVDGSHEYRDVLADIDDWVPKLRAPATVVFNDASWPGVYRALRQRVSRRGAPYRDPRLVRSTLFVRYDPMGAVGRVGRRGWGRARLALAARAATHRVVPHLPRRLKDLGNRVTSRLTSRHATSSR